MIDVEGATDDQRTTLYSNLYRLSLYPNSAFENTGTTAAPVYSRALQSSTDTSPSTPTQTGAKVVPGKVYVNNGFWDTYRTAWSAYSLLAPRMAGELVDGFVQQYRDGGWIARWSSPGYANLMTGTSSDVAFADALVKGVPGLNAADTYDAALKNATVAPPGDDPNDTSVGRKGLIESIFRVTTRKYVPPTLSASLEGGTATAGSTVRSPVAVRNNGTAPDSGDVVLSGPQSWAVEPASAHFGPVAPGASAAVSFQLTVPAGTAPGSYPVSAAVGSTRFDVGARGAVQVIGNTVEFTPGTAAEEPWLLDAGGSQLDGDARFADGGSHFDYRFGCPTW